MGLFSKWRAKKPGVFTAKELTFNRTKLQAEIVKHSAALYDYRVDHGHKVYSDYVRSLLNLEILRLSEVKPTSLDAYAYQRGKIDALRQVLDLREKFIQDKKVAKETGEKEGARSYVRPPATSAGLAI